jgi:hypothetical protein
VHLSAFSFAVTDGAMEAKEGFRRQVYNIGGVTAVYRSGAGACSSELPPGMTGFWEESLNG